MTHTLETYSFCLGSLKLGQEDFVLFWKIYSRERCQIWWLCLPLLLFPSPGPSLVRPLGWSRSFEGGRGCGSNLWQFSYVSFKICRLILKVERKCQPMCSFLLQTKTEWMWALLQRSVAKVISESLHGCLCRPLWSGSVLEKQSERSTYSSNTLTLFFYLFYQLQEQNRRSILCPLLRIRYFLSSYTTLGRSHISLCSLLEGSVMLQSCRGCFSQLFVFFLVCLTSYITGRRSSAKGWFFNSNRFWAGQTGDS